MAIITFSPETGLASSSLDPLPLFIRNGMIAMGILGVLSTASTLGLLIFITQRMIFWRSYYPRPISTNQIFILIYNLLIADLQQAMSFLFAFHWLKEGKLTGPSSSCFAQAWLIQIGDVSSGIWVLAIGIHTFVNLIIRKQIPTWLFFTFVLAIWIFCLVLTVVGPVAGGKNFFVPAGAWCWVRGDREEERLYLHYLWIFLAQLGSLVIYLSIFFILRGQLSTSSIGGGASSSNQDTAPTHLTSNGAITTTVAGPQSSHQAFTNSRKRILRTAKYMVLYPFAYVALTLPLAAGRVSAMIGNDPPLVYFCVAGSLMASCGFVDVILYITTRKALIRSSVGVTSTRRKTGKFGTSVFGSGRDRMDQNDHSVRMEEFQVGDNGNRGSGVMGKNAITISKTVHIREDSETTSLEAGASNGGDVTPRDDRSIRSLVGARKGSR